MTSLAGFSEPFYPSWNKEEDFKDTPSLAKISFDLRNQSNLLKYLEGSRRKTEMEYLINRSKTVVERAKFMLKFEGGVLTLHGLDGELISRVELPKAKCAGELGGNGMNTDNKNYLKKNNMDGGGSFSSVGAEWNGSEDWEDMEDSEEDLIQFNADNSTEEEKEQITEKQRKEWTQYEKGTPVYLGIIFKHQFVSVSAKFHNYTSRDKKEQAY